MIKYTLEPVEYQENAAGEIAAFLPGGNLDEVTVESFGNEWEQFADFERDELELIGHMYFDVLLPQIDKNTVALDAGCGTGRWSKFLSPHVKWIEAIDPSVAVHSARKLLSDCENVRVSRAGIDDIPFPDESFDLVFSVGVLHHMPDTSSGIKSCVKKIKPGGWMYVYLYYALDNRGILFRTVFQLANMLRRAVSALPESPKKLACDLLAVVCYMPLILTCRFLRWLMPNSTTYQKIPLHAYSDKSFWVIRNDCRDRFGTPLEQRFTKDQITEMLANAGLSSIQFSDKVPYWCAIGQKLDTNHQQVGEN